MAQLAEATVSTTAQVETSRKHCWECLRRRLVCDSVRPVCDRCRTSGLVCPGYDEKQPLRWVQPGRVTARSRRKPKAKAGASVLAKRGASGTTAVDGELTKVNTADRVSVREGNCSSDDELQKEFRALYLLGRNQPRTLDAIMRYDITSENFAGVQASYICKSIRSTPSPDLFLHQSITSA